MKIEIKSLGVHRMQIKAENEINRNVSIIRLFCSVPNLFGPFDYEFPSKFDFYEKDSNELNRNERSNILSDRLGIVNFQRTKIFHLDFFRIPEFDKYISMINGIINKDKNTDLELAIINTIDIFAAINDNIHFSLNFMLCIIAIESLILGGKNENIIYKLTERDNFISR